MIVQATSKVELEKERVYKLDMQVGDTLSETDRISVSSGCSKSLSLTITRKLENFEDLAREVEKLREENKMMLNRIGQLQSVKVEAQTEIDKYRASQIEAEERRLTGASAVRDELESYNKMVSTQEKLIDSIQIDLETLREENAYLTERVRKRGIEIDY